MPKVLSSVSLHVTKSIFFMCARHVIYTVYSNLYKKLEIYRYRYKSDTFIKICNLLSNDCARAWLPAE